MLPPGVPPDGSVLTLSSRLMQYVNPSRMDVPFSVILDEDKILDDVSGDVFDLSSCFPSLTTVADLQSTLESAVWEASVRVRDECSFRSWYGSASWAQWAVNVSVPLGNGVHAVQTCAGMMVDARLISLAHTCTRCMRTTKR